MPGSVLELEKENRDPATDKRLEIEAFAIASKRYALHSPDENGRPALLGRAGKLRRSEHGLGHLQPPRERDPEAKEPGWQDQWWHHLLCQELGIHDKPPAWFDEPAIGRLTVASPHDLAAFKTYNRDRRYCNQVKPWNFLAMAHPTGRERARPNGPRSLVAAFERDPDKRRAADWFDRGNPTLEPRPIRTDQHDYACDDSFAVLSYGHYYDSYRTHPELKALAPDGTHCHRWTRGLLTPRHLAATTVLRVGKESNRLADEPLPADDETETTIEYPEPRTCRGCPQAVTGRRKWCSEACRKRAARARRRATSSDAANS